MPDPSALPADVLLHILSHIPYSDRRTLAACARTSRVFYAVAAPRLYHTVHISSHSHLYPFFDAVPSAPATRGPLAKRRGAIGRPVRSRKARLMDESVRVLQVDGRTDGPFSGIRAAHLPAVRTVLFDMSLTMTGDPSGNRTWLDNLSGSEGEYATLAGCMPRTVVLKHLAFHESINLPDALPVTTQSQIQRLVYILEFTNWDHDHFGRIYGSSNAISSFGLNQWLDNLSDPPPKLREVDIVFWTRSPGLHFSVPGNKYAYQRGRDTWLEKYIAHIAETFPLRSTFNVNFVNAGSFDQDAVRAQVWDYGALQEAFKKTLLRELGQPRKGSPKWEEVVQFVSMKEWLDGIKRDGVDRWDIFTREELQPWLGSDSTC